MNRRSLVSRVLSVAGALLLVVATIHLLVTPLLRRYLLAQDISAKALENIFPPFLLNHLVVGILLIPIGLSSLYSSLGIRDGQRWAWVISVVNGITILSLPVVLAATMEARFFGATPFLVAAVLITLIGFAMTAGVLWVRNDFKK